MSISVSPKEKPPYTDFGNNSDGSEITADTRRGLKNGKFLLIGSGERKNEFFKLCLPGFKVLVMSFDYFELTSLFWGDISINGITEFRKFLRDFPKSYPVSPEQICRRCPRQRFPTGYWKP